MPLFTKASLEMKDLSLGLALLTLGAMEGGRLSVGSWPSTNRGRSIPARPGALPIVDWQEAEDSLQRRTTGMTNRPAACSTRY